jgi:hypothetical protein
MKMKCPSCGAPVPARNINIQELVAVCEECDTVFGVSDLVARAKSRLESGGKAKNVVHERPPAITLTESGDRFMLDHRWRIQDQWSGATAMLLVLLVLAVIAGLAIMTRAPIPGLLVMLAAASFPVYSLLAMALNHTRIDITDDSVTKQTGPLPYVGYKRLGFALDEVERFSVRLNRHMDSDNMRHLPADKLFYNVIAEMDDGREIKLLEFENYANTHYAAQELERWRRELLALAGEGASYALPALDLTQWEGPLIDGELPVDIPDDAPLRQSGSDQG